MILDVGKSYIRHALATARRPGYLHFCHNINSLRTSHHRMARFLRSWRGIAVGELLSCRERFDPPAKEQEKQEQ
jgi:hypothetical protein